VINYYKLLSICIDYCRQLQCFGGVAREYCGGSS